MTAWLLDTLLYTGLLIALVLVLRGPVGRHFGPQTAYALWALPFLRLLLPPVVLPASLAPEPAEVPAAAAEGWVAALPAEPVTFVAVAEPVALATPSEPGLLEGLGLAEIALGVWLAVALAFLAWRFVGYRRMRRVLLAEARPVGEIGKVRLVETPALTAPVAFGVLDKVIALPPLFMAQRDVAARDLAIAHELAHHRGHDLLANFAAQALLALHWFNPLAWLGWRAMRRDQEAACDARVLAGRDRGERARYAALIAGTAAGQRLALAAPMACPMLGDKSIIHRLRSLSMSGVTPARRRFGRVLLGATALALPLTASISYSAATAQEPAPPAPQAPRTLDLPPAPAAAEAPLAPEAPQAPESVEANEADARTVVLRREGQPGVQPGSQVRTFALQRVEGVPMPPMPAMPQFEFHAWGSPDDPEFEARMEAWGREMEEWGERWGEQYAEQMRAQAEAWAEAARHAPEVVESCDQNERRRTTTDDGRARIVICTRDFERLARSSLRQARNSIAMNREISEEIRREVLEDLDEEIARIERETD